MFPLAKNEGAQMTVINGRRTITFLVVLHAVAAVVMIAALITFACVPLDATLIQTTSFLVAGEGPMGNTTTVILENSPKATTLIYVFVACAALDHILCACFGVFRRAQAIDFVYKWQFNPLRWIEYSVSASVMMVLLVSLCGVRDIFTQLLCGCCTAICMLIGAVMEKSAKTKSFEAIMLFAIASFACLVPWVVLLSYFAAATSAPLFVWFAMLGTMMAFMLFAVNMACYRLFGWYSFRVGETFYVVLSLTAKIYLAFTVWGGFLANATATP